MSFLIPRNRVFRSVCLVLAGSAIFFVLSLASSSLRAVYVKVAQESIVSPLQNFVVSGKENAKKRRMDKKEMAQREVSRQASSLTSPYVEVGGDSRFPLLVQVWVNVDASHTARVVNEDERFPLVYERAVSAQGFVPVVGLAFGDNRFTLEIRDSENKLVARHRLSATIEDKEEIQSWVEVHKSPARNDFLSIALPWGYLFGRAPEIKYLNIVDDLGTVRWTYRWEGKLDRGRAGYQMLGDVQRGNRFFVIEDEGIKIVSVGLFGDRKVVFDGESYSREHDYKVHHDLSVTDKGTLLLVADPIEKGGVKLPNQPKILSEEDTILEIDLESGKILREIDLKEVFADNSKRPMLEDQGILPHKKSDWMHLNSIHYDADSGSIVLSGRNQSAVFALDYDTGSLKWLFADPEGWPDQEALPLLAAPQGYRYHRGQHDAILEGNRLRFFDNSVLVPNGAGGYLPASQARASSRIVEATLDLPNKRVANIKIYAPENFYSKITGGYNFGDGKYLLCYCGIMKDAFGEYVSDFRNSTGVDGESQLFEFAEGSNRQLLHFTVKGLSFRPRYFDWQQMVKAK